MNYYLCHCWNLLCSIQNHTTQAWSKMSIHKDWVQKLFGEEQTLFEEGTTPQCGVVLASSPGHSQILSCSQPRPQATPRFYLAAVEKNPEKAWDQNYITDRKWWTQYVMWTRFVLTESTISDPWRSFDPRPSPNFSPRLWDKIWEWPGDEARVVYLHMYVWYIW